MACVHLRLPCRALAWLRFALLGLFCLALPCPALPCNDRFDFTAVGASAVCLPLTGHAGACSLSSSPDLHGRRGQLHAGSVRALLLLLRVRGYARPVPLLSSRCHAEGQDLPCLMVRRAMPTLSGGTSEGIVYLFVGNWR